MKYVTKRLLSLLLTVAMLCGLCVPAAFAAESRYGDIQGHWAEGAIERWSDYDIVQGYGGDFHPDEALTRAQMATILSNTLGLTKTVINPFTDVKEDDWFASFVIRCYAAGLMVGFDGKAMPEATITRQEAMVMLCRTLGIAPVEKPDLSAYADSDKVSDWAAPFMAAMVESGIISGIGNNQLGAISSMNRASLMTVLDNAVVQYINEPGTYTLTNKDGIILVAAGNVALSGKTGADILVTPAADGKALTFDKAIVTGSITVQADNAKITSKNSKLPNITMTGEGSKVEESKPSFVISGDDDDGGSITVSLESAAILRGDENVAGVALKSGDELKVSVLPTNASYTVQWLAGGAEVGTSDSYTVSAMDVGKTITVKVTGTGSYAGSVIAPATGAVTAEVDLSGSDPDASPVVIDSEAVFKDAEGNLVTVDENATVTLEVTSDTSPDVSEGVSGAVDDALTIAFGADTDVTVNYVAVNADLVMTTITDGEPDEAEIHPVGETTLTLSKENLGIPADEDISNYTFMAHHTNVDGDDEVITGEMVIVDGEQRVRFTLNGLSRVYIGNVPPLTVTFDTDGGSEIPAQKVKLGGYAKDVEPPVKVGWLFAGWDHDIQTENIIKDITVTARWIKGTTAAENQVSGTWQQDGEPVADPEHVQYAFSNGTVTLTLDAEAEYAANLSYVLSVAPMEGAVKMATATTAEGAMAAGETDYTDAAPAVITAVVTDENGAVKTSNTNLYIKWVAEDGTILGLQSARLVVRTPNSASGNYDTQTRVETFSVNRGLGQVEFYLTDGTDRQGNAIPDFAGVVNGYLRSDDKEYVLDLYGSFYEEFRNYNEIYTGKNYTGVKVVIKPFEGERFSRVPTVDAFYDAEGVYESVPYSDKVSAELKDGNIVLTCAKPASEANYVWMNFELTLGDVTQHFSIDIDNYTYNSEDWTRLTTESWDEALNALRTGTNQVYYMGDQSVILNTDLTLAPDQALFIENNNMTIAAGGKLTLECDDLHGSDLNIWNGSLTVADGGTLTTNSQKADQNRFYIAYVRAEKGITVASGGTLSVPERGELQIHNGRGGFSLEEGGQITNACGLNVDRDADSTVDNVVAGTVTNTSHARMEFNDGLTIASTGSVTLSDNSWFEVYGGLTVYAGGELTCGGNEVTLSGRTENYGTITMNSGTLYMWNTGYSVYNSGTISVADRASLNIEGTVLVNTGSLTGSGTLYFYEFADDSSYDNGIEYVRVEEENEDGYGSNRTPDNYDRYKFVKDPATTVDVIYFIGELSNQNGGTSTLTECK